MIPLLDSSLVGVICILAGASFFLPKNRMGVAYRTPIAILYLVWGIVYLYTAFVPMADSDRIPIMRVILGSMGACVIVSNVISFAIESLRVRALKRAGLFDHERRRTNEH